MACNIFLSVKLFFPVIAILLILHVSPASAFGAGNIASISKIEGMNWRHGDIEDMLKTVAFIKGHKWTTLMVKRVYFGNWLRDYSQAVDVGTLKGVQSEIIRILVWVLSFLSFGYATAEFEVTAERLGVYRPEEHIDNPKDYADNLDARRYDKRLRPPVQPVELQIDPRTGMKNYIANESVGIATSSGYIKHTFERSIHFGRQYTSSGWGHKGKEEDLCEALRCLGQGLHCLEDFAAHTNYIELALREMGYGRVFSHTGSATEITLRGKAVYPLVTGTFGSVDFLMSVLGEAQDHFTQSEVNELDTVLREAQEQESSAAVRSRTAGQSDSECSVLIGLLKRVPGAGSLCQQAEDLQAQSQAQERWGLSHSNRHSARNSTTYAAPPGSAGGPPGPGIPGVNSSFDAKKTIAQIYPILQFRDKVVRLVDSTIAKIPGLEALVEKITDTVTLFVLSLLAPFIRPIIEAITKKIRASGNTVVDASGKHQYEPWTDPQCSNPTHSFLSKDHFSNILNEPAGHIASAILKYVAPRIIYAWENPNEPVHHILNDVLQVFHHPANRDPSCGVHRDMYAIVEQWARIQHDKGADINDNLSPEGVRAGKNNRGVNDTEGHSHGILPSSLIDPSSGPNQAPTYPATTPNSASAYGGNQPAPYQQPPPFGTPSNTQPYPQQHSYGGSQPPTYAQPAYSSPQSFHGTTDSSSLPQPPYPHPSYASPPSHNPFPAPSHLAQYSPYHMPPQQRSFFGPPYPQSAPYGLPPLSHDPTPEPAFYQEQPPFATNHPNVRTFDNRPMQDFAGPYSRDEAAALAAANAAGYDGWEGREHDQRYDHDDAGEGVGFPGQWGRGRGER